MSSPFAGTLHGKRKADLIDIAEALALDTKGTITGLKDIIQAKLDKDSDTLKHDPRFKGLYGRTRRHPSDDADSPDPDNKTPVSKPRKSLGRTVERLAEAAGIPLPDSPISVSKVRGAAKEAGETAREVGGNAYGAAREAGENAYGAAREAGENAYGAAREVTDVVRDMADQSLALVDTESQAVAQYSQAVQRYVAQGTSKVETIIRELQAPDNLLTAAIVIEAAMMYNNVAPYHRYAMRFPPSADDSIIGSALSWLPSVKWTLSVPRHSSLLPSSSLWPAFTWWFFTTVAPPLVLSTIVSYVPQRRYQTSETSTPTIDALTFAIFRLFILLVPLTGAAPDSFSQALEFSGNPELRALGAGLLVALVVAQRLAA